MKIAIAVGKQKRAAGREVYDPERERAILKRLTENAPEPLTATQLDPLESWRVKS